MLFIYSREDEIRDARDKRCSGHGWTSIRGASVKIYSVLFMHWLTSAFKEKWPKGGGCCTERERESEREGRIQRDGGQDKK